MPITNNDNRACTSIQRIVYLAIIVFLFPAIVFALDMQKQDSEHYKEPVIIVRHKKVISVTAALSIYSREAIIDGKKTFEGPIISLVTQFFNEQGITVNTKVLPWKRTLAQLKTGELDAVLTFFYSKERTGFTTYSENYGSVDSSIFVKKGEAFPFTQWDDLIGREGLIIEGRSEGAEFDAFKNRKLNVKGVTTLLSMTGMLIRGRAAYAIDKKRSIIIETKKAGLWDQIEILPSHLTSNKIYIGFSKKSPYARYIPGINQKIKELTINGTLKKWVNEAMDIAVKQK